MTMRSRTLFVLLAVAIVAAIVQSAGAATLAPPNARLSESYGKIPLSFEANQGQVDPAVKFVSRGHGYSLFLTPQEAVLGLTHDTSDSTVLRWHVVGANHDPRVSGESVLEKKSNYFRGNDPAKWHTGVANFARVRYESILPGIDLVYHGNQRQIEYDFVVAPGTSPKAIGVAFTGARSMKIGPHGELVLHTKDGDLVQNAPVVYQEIDGTRRTVDGRYAIQGKNRIGFVVGDYDRHQPLVIDPTLAYSTYLGGNDLDQGHAIAVDGSGNVYLTGLVVSSNFPGVTSSSLQPSPGGDYDGYVTKINSTGTAIVWSTYLGGSGGNEYGQAIAVDGSGYVYVSGVTNSSDFPGIGSGSLQSTYGGYWRDMFLVKLVPAGNSLVYSTYIGGNGDEAGGALLVDSSGGVYMSGQTSSTNFPGVTSGSIQSSNAGGYDGVLFHVNSGATAIDWATYLGGTGDDFCGGMALDGSGNIYLACSGNSSTFPGVNSGSLQPSNAGNDDAIILKVDSSGSSILAGTFFGGSDDDFPAGLGLDSSGNVYVAGTTLSTDFPVSSSPFQSSNAGSYDVTLTKFDSSLSSVLYSTYVGGSDIDFANGLGVDASGNCYVIGSTASTTFPGVNSGSIQSTNGGGFSDVLVFVMNPSGTGMVMSTFLGGSDDDEAIGPAFDSSGGIYLTGWTASTNYPVTSGVLQTTYGGGDRDGFISKINVNAGNATITGVSPATGRAGDTIHVYGDGFGSSQGSGAVWLGSTYGTVTSWSNTEIVATIVSGATSGVAQVYQSSVWGNQVTLTVITPNISSISPTTGRAGDSITITGTGFGASQGSGAVWLGSTYGSVTSWSDTSIVATIVSGASSGVAQVYQGGVWSNQISLTVITPSISSISPTTGRAGDSITITGTGFGASQGSGNVWLGSTYGTVTSWSDTSIVATIVSGATSGVAQVYQGGVWSNQISLTVITPNITSISPTHGTSGTQVTFTGTGFGTTQGSGAVWLGSTYGTIVSWSDTSIVASVASSASSGVAQVYQGGVWSNQISFSVP